MARKRSDKGYRADAGQFFIAGELCRRGLVAVVTTGKSNGSFLQRERKQAPVTETLSFRTRDRARDRVSSNNNVAGSFRRRFACSQSPGGKATCRAIEVLVGAAASANRQQSTHCTCTGCCDPPNRNRSFS